MVMRSCTALSCDGAVARVPSRSIVSLTAGERAIVLGVSGNPTKLLHLEPTIADNVPVIRRFTGLCGTRAFARCPSQIERVLLPAHTHTHGAIK